MVYLNENVSINIKLLEKILMEKLGNIVEHELYYIDNIDDEKKDKITKNILKEIKNEIKKDIFIYRIMDDKKCTFKHSRGNKDGYFCCKNITHNGDKDKYLCRIHNKYHISTKKNIKRDDNYKVSDNNISISKSVNITTINNNKNSLYKLPSIQYQNIIFKNKMKKNKYYIKNINLKNIKNIIKYYSLNTICKYNNNGLCHNIDKYGKCDFKHINNSLIFNDYIDIDNNNWNNFNVPNICSY